MSGQDEVGLNTLSQSIQKFFEKGGGVQKLLDEIQRGVLGFFSQENLAN